MVTDYDGGERDPRTDAAMLQAKYRLLQITAEGAGVLDRADWLLVMARLFLRGAPDPGWRDRATRHGAAHEPEVLEAVERCCLDLGDGS